MLWDCYVTYREQGQIEYKCRVKKLDLPDTERSDMGAVVIIAAKRFKVPEDMVLCLPSPIKEPHNPVKFRNDFHPRHTD
jgi:hypothetical protein